MTDELKEKFAVLTDDQPEPADPAIQVRQSIVRRRHRRGGLAVMVCAAATAAAVLAVPALGSLRSAIDQPGVAGSLPTTASPTTEGTRSPIPITDHDRVLPRPWSDEAVTQQSIANTFWPNKGYYIAKGRISTGSWAVVVYSRENCLLGLDGPSSTFGVPHMCFDRASSGKSDRPASGKHYVLQGFTAEKSTNKIDATMVWGTTLIGASAVQVKAGGKTYTAPAVATPATDTSRFFALVIPKRDLKVTSVTPVDKAGKPITTSR